MLLRPYPYRTFGCVIAVLLATWAYPAEPIAVTGFQFGDNGSKQSSDLPPDFLANLKARGNLVPQATAAQDATWPEIFAGRSARQLVVVHTTFGTRIELLGMLLDEQGVCRQAVRRSGSTLFSARRDWGEPGAGQGVVNAYHELAGDLEAAMGAMPDGIRGTPLTARVVERKAERLSAGSLRDEHRFGLEALLLATPVMNRTPVVLSDASAESDITLHTQPRAIYFDFHLRTPGGQSVQKEVDRANLFPYLLRMFRQAEHWDTMVTGFRLFSTDWKPLKALAVQDKVAVCHSGGRLFGLEAATGHEQWQQEGVSTAYACGHVVFASGKAGRGVVLPGSGEFSMLPKSVGRQPKVLNSGRRQIYVEGRELTYVADEVQWHREFANPIGHVLLGTSGFLVAFVDDGVFYVLEPNNGDIHRRHEIGLRVRNATQIGSHFWVTDMDGALLALTQDGQVVWRQQLADIPLTSPIAYANGVCIVTQSREAYLIGNDGSVNHRFTFPCRLQAVLPVTVDEEVVELVMADMSGSVWSWPRDALKPHRRVDLATRLTDSLVLAPSFVMNWQHMTTVESNQLQLAEPLTARLILAADRDGYLYQIAYPF